MAYDEKLKAIENKQCPICKKGKMKTRKGKYGTFSGCSCYPDCTFNFGIEDINIEHAIIRYNEKVAIYNILKQASQDDIGNGNALGYISMALGVKDSEYGGNSNGPH